MRWVACLGVYEMMKTFKFILHRSLVWIFTHKSTKKIMEDTFVKLMEDPKTNEIMEKCLEQALLNYAKNTGYKI